MVNIGSFSSIKPLIKKLQKTDIEPFCQKWWKDVDIRSYRRSCGSVTYHGHLNGINHHLTTGANPSGLRKTFFGTGITPKDMIEITDAEFKALPKTKETIKAFRCVGEKPEFFKQDYARYSKSLQVKKGDIITMPEYAYATSDIGYAKVYLPNDKGILYDIEIPSGSRVSLTGCGINNEIVFPRASRFECIGKEEVNGITTIKLKYIQPMDITSWYLKGTNIVFSRFVYLDNINLLEVYSQIKW